MRYYLVSASVLLFFFYMATLSAQNLIPVVSNVSAVSDTANKRIDVIFDISDPESSSMEVWLQVSADSGKTWIVPVDSVSGDTGYPIVGGTGKQISWYYDPLVMASYGSGITGFRIRVVADDKVTIDLQEVVDQVDSARILSDLKMLEVVRHRTTNLTALEATKDTLEDRMAKAGLHPFRQGEIYGSYQGENIVGFKSGTRNAKKSWLISGHFDTVASSPGADDNATGVATVQEAVRILSTYQTKHSIRFINFDLEEPGLVGSIQYLQSGPPVWKDMQGLLNMDGIGYYSDVPGSQTVPNGFGTIFPTATSQILADSSKGNFILSIVNTASASLDTVFRSNAATYQPGLRVISLVTPGTGTQTPDLRRSDHAPFWDIGTPAIFFSDGSDFRNPTYHSPNDTVGTLNMPFLLKNIRSILVTLADLAGLEHSGTGESNEILIQLPVGRDGKLISSLPVLSVFPNPSSGKVHLQLDLPQAGFANLEICDHHGHFIQKVQNGWMQSGKREIEWETDLSSGHYILLFEINGRKVFSPIVILD